MFTITKIDVMWEKIKALCADMTGVENRLTTVEALATKIPKDYSATVEVNTGQKWVDGKYIYMKYFSGTFPTITEASNQILASDLVMESLVDADLLVELSEDYTFKMVYAISYNKSNNRLTGHSIGTSYSEKDYYGYVRYTKPDPVPGETKKTKRSKKEDKT